MQKNNAGEFSGVWTALVTPFNKDLSLDLKNFEKLLEMQASAKVAGVVVAGTTGESPTLSVQEKMTLIRKARSVLPRTIRVMAGTGGSDTNQSAELSKLAVDSGADSLLVVTPPYNKPTTDGLIKHFEYISRYVPQTPICLYHVPGRTAQFLSVETLAKLCTLPKILGVKEASGDLGFFSRSKIKTSTTGKNVSYLSGDDPTYLPSLAAGGVGVISVISNIFPQAMVALTDAFAGADFEKAYKIHQILFEAIDIIFCESNPGPIKAALHLQNYGENLLRLPLASVTESNFERIKQTSSHTAHKLEKLLS